MLGYEYENDDQDQYYMPNQYYCTKLVVDDLRPKKYIESRKIQEKNNYDDPGKQSQNIIGKLRIYLVKNSPSKIMNNNFP